MSGPRAVRFASSLNRQRVLVTLLAATATAAPVFAQSDGCNSALTVSKPRSSEYQLRRIVPDSAPPIVWCEGTHARPVAGSTLRLLSFMRTTNDEPSIRDRLYISWTAPFAKGALGSIGDTVRIVARSLKREKGYQMDFVAPPSQRKFTWAVERFRASGLTRSDFGIVGSTPYTLNGARRDVLVPLDVRLESATMARIDGPYVVILASSAPLVAISVAVMSVDDSGQPRGLAAPVRDISLGYHAPNKALEVPLPALAAPGLYRVEIGAKHDGQPPSTYVFFFSHVLAGGGG